MAVQDGAMYTFVFSSEKLRGTYNSWNQPTRKQLASTRGQFDLRMLNKGLSDYTVTGYGEHEIHKLMKSCGLDQHTRGHFLQVPTAGDAVWVKLNHDVLFRNGKLKLVASFKDLDVEPIREAAALFTETAKTLAEAEKESTSTKWSLTKLRDVSTYIGSQQKTFTQDLVEKLTAAMAQAEQEFKKNTVRIQVLTEARDFQRNKVLEALKQYSLTSFGS
jgi:hypothetical protein